MEFSDIRWWHWMLASLLFGAVLSYAYNGMETIPDIRSSSLIQFEMDIGEPPITDVKGQKFGWVKDIVVYPAISLPDENNKGVEHKANIVVYKVQVPRKDDANIHDWQQRWFSASLPFSPTGQAFLSGPERRAMSETKKLPPGVQQWYFPKPEDTAETIAKAVYHDTSATSVEMIKTANQDFRRDPTIAKILANRLSRLRPGDPLMIPWSPDKGKSVLDWLAASKAENSTIQYRYAWWREPKWTYAVGIGGSFLIMGIITPSVLSLMMGMGLVKRGKQKDMDLSRYGKRASVKTKLAPVSTSMTPEELDQLNAFEERVKAGLADAIPAPAPAVARVESGPARVMTNEALAAPVAGADADEIKEFGGEFYPVVVSTHKPGEEPHAPGVQPTAPTRTPPPAPPRRPSQ